MKQCCEVQNHPGSSRGGAEDPVLDIHNEQIKKRGENMEWVCLAGAEKG